MDALIALGCTIRRVGSRVTCNPVPVGTDEDFLALVPFNVTKLMKEDGFTQDGSPEFYTGNDNGGFRSFRKGDMNIITTESTEFFDRFMTATALAKRFNLLEKADRIALFQAVLYGVDADALEPPAYVVDAASKRGRE